MPAAAPAGRRWLPWAAALVAGGLGLLAGATLLGRRAVPPEPVRRFEINLTEDSVFSRLGSGLVASPDGRAIVYTTGQEGETQRLVLRPLDRFQETVLSSGASSAGTYNPFFSPDGEWLGFVTPRELKKISVTGGAPITLAAVERSRGATWGKDGTIVFAPAVLSGRAGKPELVFRGPFLGGIRGLLLPGFNFPDYDVSGDGRRFVMFAGGRTKRSATRARVVLNWFDELKRLTSAGGR